MPSRRGREDGLDRRMESDVVVRVEVPRRPACEGREGADLRLELRRDLPGRQRGGELLAAPAEAAAGSEIRDVAGADAGGPPPVRAKWRPSERPGARSAASRIPRAAAFSSTITVADVTMPRSYASRVPTLIPGRAPEVVGVDDELLHGAAILQQNRRG